MAQSSSPFTGTDYRALVLQAIDVVQLIGQSVALKRRGKDFVGLCPFHQEKTPSFHVSPSKQFFHCYGCKAGGNAIDFVIKRDRIEFIDALKLLARQANIELPKYSQKNENAGERQMLLEAHSAACALFEKLLSNPQEGVAARAYLEQRGFTTDSIKKFQIGFVPNAWDTLLKSPVGRKFTPQQLALAGLAKPRSGESGGSPGYYDTFRNRIIFPIRNESGQVIAFGGRVMPESDDPAKYLNSPETPLFSKSRCIFGIDLARQRIVETRTVAVVEGYTDVVMAHQYGVTNVVSILGTAMTEQHITIMRRFADRIVLLFDADTAGDLAVNRAVELFLTQPVEIAIASMPDGVDPDEFLLEQGTEAFDKLLAGALDALEYKWRQLSRQYKAADDLTGQQKAVQEYLELLASARGSGPVDSLRWGAALTRVSRLTEIPVDQLNRRFRASKIAQKRQPASSDAQAAPNPAEKAQPVRPVTAQDRAERWILGVVLAEPNLWHSVQQHVHLEDFSDDGRRKLAEIYWNHQRDEGEPVFNEFLNLLPDSGLVELAVELMGEAEGLQSLEQTLNDAISHLAESRRRTDAQKLVAQLRRTNNDDAASTSPTAEDDEIALLKKLQESARRPDLRRV